MNVPICSNKKVITCFNKFRHLYCYYFVEICKENEHTYSSILLSSAKDPLSASDKKIQWQTCSIAERTKKEDTSFIENSGSLSTAYSLARDVSVPTNCSSNKTPEIVRHTIFKDSDQAQYESVQYPNSTNQYDSSQNIDPTYEYGSIEVTDSTKQYGLARNIESIYEYGSVEDPNSVAHASSYQVKSPLSQQAKLYSLTKKLDLKATLSVANGENSHAQRLKSIFLADIAFECRYRIVWRSTSLW